MGEEGWIGNLVLLNKWNGAEEDVLGRCLTFRVEVIGTPFPRQSRSCQGVVKVAQSPADDHVVIGAQESRDEKVGISQTCITSNNFHYYIELDANYNRLQLAQDLP